MGGPPSIQRLLSMIWLGNLMYPDVFDYDIDDRVKEFYSLFFRYDLTDAELNDLMVYAKPAPASAPTGAAAAAQTSAAAQATATTEAPAPLFGVLAGLAAAAVVAGRGRNR
jgi:iron complex transport system substrate-binding protein